MNILPNNTHLIKSNYRADIDGLRALSIICVMLFHLNIDPFQGGFIGVDVFFVISGYLITKIIKDELELSNSFSFVDFYIKRARRLFPALFFTLFISTIAACFLFSPQNLTTFGNSLVFSTIYISNIYFWLQSGYFAPDSDLVPLLHTWSLSVEEQFYLIWPFIILFLLKNTSKIVTFILICIFAIFSLYLNVLFEDGSNPFIAKHFPNLMHVFDEGSSTIYFLSPFRAFEFAIGAMLVFLNRDLVRRNIVLESLWLLGLMIIIISALILNKNMPYPSFYGLLPCSGAALIIYSGKSKYLSKILNNKVMVSVGLISYPLYLIHWPLIVFYKHNFYRDLFTVDKISILVISFLIAFFIFRFIEMPFRTKKNKSQKYTNKQCIYGYIITSIFMITIGLSIVLSDGWSFRLKQTQNILSSKQHRAIETDLCRTTQPNIKPFITCSFERNSKKSIYVWGDSHARHLIGGLSEHYPNHNIRILYLSNCLPQSGLFDYKYNYKEGTKLTTNCIQRNKNAFDFFANIAPTNIVLSYYTRLGDSKNNKLIQSTQEIIKTLSDNNHRIFALGDVIRPDRNLVACYQTPVLIGGSTLQQKCVGDPSTAKFMQNANNKLEYYLGSQHFINPNDVFCSEKNCLTEIDGNLIFRDKHHLTLFGSTFFIGKVLPKLEIK